MKKKIRFWLLLTTQIMVVCLSGMFMTFTSEWLRTSGFFGDTKRTTPVEDGEFGSIDKWHDWGVRHYWYFWMMFVLFILVITRILMWADWYWSDHNKKVY